MKIVTCVRVKVIEAGLGLGLANAYELGLKMKIVTCM